MNELNCAQPSASSSILSSRKREDRGRLGSLDLLRAVAIVSVVLAHYALSMSPPISVLRYGWIGVDLFFVLSGYLIGGQLFGLQATHRFIPLKAFYMRRFMRTLPAYYVVLALHLAIPALHNFKSSKEALIALSQYATFTQNLTLALPFFQISWSLCVEEHFYLLLPLVIIFVLRHKNRRGVYWIFALVMLSQVLIRGAILVYGFHKYVFQSHQETLAYMANIYYPTYCRLDGLTIGVALAALQNYRPDLWSKLMGFGNKLLVAGGLTLIAALFLMWPRHYVLGGSLVFTLLSISFGLFTASALSRECILNKFRLHAVSILAELAYSIYLTHLVALFLAGWLIQRVGMSGNAGLSFTLSMVVVLLTAVALFVLVERPGLRLRDRMFAYPTQKPVHAASAEISSRD